VTEEEKCNQEGQEMSEECTGKCQNEENVCSDKEAEENKEEVCEPKKTEDMSKEELLDLVKRTQANFENFKKQNMERVNEVVGFANKKLLTELLPTLDSFEMALRGSENAQGDVKVFLEGMKMVLDSFVKVLTDNGVKRIEQLSSFDPKIHEAMEKVVDESLDEGTVLDVVQSGYMIKDKIVRAARVKISTKKKEE